jgi:hypothetical protein
MQEILLAAAAQFAGKPRQFLDLRNGIRITESLELPK